MDEMQSIKEAITAMRETLIFLTEQEKIRGEEVNALNEKIEAVNSYMMENLVTPLEGVAKEARYSDFNEKYGERLSQYNDAISAMEGKPADLSRETFEMIEGAPEEDKLDEEKVDSYVERVEDAVKEKIAALKNTLGIPEDASIKVEQDENGETKVEADVDGDGEMETVADTAEEVSTEETDGPSEEETDDEEVSDEEEVEDPKLQKKLDEYMTKNY